MIKLESHPWVIIVVVDSDESHQWILKQGDGWRFNCQGHEKYGKSKEFPQTKRDEIVKTVAIFEWGLWIEL